MDFYLKRDSLLSLEILCFLVISFSLAFSSEEDTLDLDMELILSGIEYYDSQIQSGEGDVIYRRIQTPGLSGSDGHDMTHEYHLTFKGRKTRMDIPEHFTNIRDKSRLRFPKLTYIVGEGEWKIQYELKRSHTLYMYSTTANSVYLDWDPRQITKIMSRELSVSEHLKKKRFKVKGRQNLAKIVCYLLENNTDDTDVEKIWIAPDLGFRFLKYEHKFPLAVDHPQRGLKKGTPMVNRIWVSYQKYGEAWFPKQSITESARIDEKGQEHLHSKTQIETKNFRLNHLIPEKTFIPEIPDDAMIWVADLGESLSKKEFFKLYGLK